MTKAIRLARLTAIACAVAALSLATFVSTNAAASCSLTTVTAATIQAAVKTCAGGTITLPAGTFLLTGRVAVNQSVTIDGAGQTLTHLVQTAQSNIFQITALHVTIENLDVDTSRLSGSPAPATMFSNASFTSILNVDSESNTGFGFRITGPSPCDSFLTLNTVVANVNETNNGTGGFAGIDVDCTNGATITNIVIHGNYLALYQVENVTLNGEYSRPTVQKACVAPWYISGPSNHLLMENVNGAGQGIAKASSRGPVTYLTIVNNTYLPGC